MIQNGSAILDLFFILSGFVICNAYGGKISTGREFFDFMWLRLGRLYPMHLLMLFVFVGIEIAKYVAEVGFGLVAVKSAFVINNGYSFLTNALLIHSLGVHDSVTYNFPSWTISVEFATYIVFGTLLLLVRKTRWVLAISVVLIGASVTVLILVDASSRPHEVSYDYGFFRCVEGFFIGVLLCHIYKAVTAKHPGLASRHQ